MNRIFRLWLRPVQHVQGWFRVPRLTLRTSAGLGVVLTPFTAGSQVAMLERLLGGLDSLGPLPIVLFALLVVGSLVAAGFQLWVSSRVLGEVTPLDWEAVELSPTRRAFELLRIPTGVLLGLVGMNILVLPVVAVGAVAWAVLSLAGAILWFAGTVLTVGALSSAVSREAMEAAIWWAFEILTAPRHLFALEELMLTAMGPIGLAPLLLLFAVLAPTALAGVIYTARADIQRV